MMLSVLKMSVMTLPVLSKMRFSGYGPLSLSPPLAALPAYLWMRAVAFPS